MTPSGSERARHPEHLELGPPRVRRRRTLARRTLRAALAGVGTAVVRALLVVATSSGWRPPPEEPPLGAAPLPSVAPWDRHLPYAFVDRSETVTAAGDRARVVRPRGAEGTIPGIVLVVGSGRADDLATEAEALARGGLAVLTYDQRDAGWSPFEPASDRPVDDALAALDVVARQPGVDPGRVGLLGYGAGGRVVPVAAGLSPSRVRIAGRPAPARVAFTVLVSAPVVSPLEQAAWRADRALAGAPDALRASVAGGIALGGVVDRWRTDAGPTLAAALQPTYAVWGADDRTVPVVVAAERLRAATGDRSRIEVVPGAAHRVPVGTGWAERVSDWVRRGYPVDDVVRGVEPATRVGLSTLPTAGPWGDPRLLLGLAVLAAVVAGGWPVRRPVGASLRSARSG